MRGRRATPRKVMIGTAVALSGTIAIVVGATTLVTSNREPVPVRVGTEDRADEAPGDASSNAPSLPLRLERVTAQDIRLTATLDEGWLPPGSWQHPECVDPLTFSLTSSAAARGEGSAEVPFPAADDDEVAIMQLTTSNGTAALAVAGPGVDRIEAHFTDGAIDEADAVDGLAVVAFDAGSDPGELPVYSTIDTATIELRDGGQVAVTLADLAGHRLIGVDGRPRATAAELVLGAGGCGAPVEPTLPPAGVDQPEPGAEDAVRAAITTVADGTLTLADRAALTTRPDIGNAIFGELPEGLRVDGGGMAATIDSVVFLDATTALAIVDLLVDGNPLTSNGYVKVVETSEGWRVTWESVCRFTSGFAPLTCADVPADYPEEARVRAGG